MSFQITGEQSLSKTMTTFSGCDIKAYFENVEIGNLQGISLSVNREVRPVFTMGRTDVVSYSRGKRGVAGSLIMTVFDRDAFWDIKEVANYYAKHSDLKAGGGSAASITKIGGSLKNHPNYSDQIPPFNITLVAQNEFGNAMVMRIYGVHLVSEGQGMSVDDNVAESQFTFVAHNVQWWAPLDEGSTERNYLTTENITILGTDEPKSL
ncbi:hypothetical protein [Acinetobacter sp.]|uniref:hypothetical protein n=1 Tax=Acinetobacter sp. TaxID=472 RepID=UPI003D010B0F